MLDMAPFVMEAAPDDGSDTNPESSAEDRANAVTAAQKADEARRACCFGKNDAPLGPADAATVQASPDGRLIYELFAVLIHFGAASMGHYYS